MNRFLAQITVSIISFLIVMMGAVLASVFTTIALNAAFLEHMAPSEAALLTAFTVLAVCLLVAIAAHFTVKLVARPRPAAPAQDAAALLGGILGEELHDRLARNSGLAATIALLFGFCMGVSPGLRRTVRNHLKETF